MRYQFRAWCNKQKKMFNSSDQKYIGEVFYWLFEGQDIEIMLSTGLFDRNKVEIYEGDILEFDKKEWGGDDDNISVVTWDKEGGRWETISGLNRECNEWKTVIGNIYENPELVPK